MASLRETQQLFWQLITAPEGVTDGLRQLDMKPAELAGILGGDERLDASQRLDIYANMYFWRLADILRGDYSAVAAAAGDERFHNLVTDYLLACPSEHPSVRNVGARLPDYLATHALGLERPWLAELARLERTRIELFDGPDADSLTLDELRALPTDAYVSLPLPLIPSHRLLDVSCAIEDVWRAADAGEELPIPEPGARTLLIWRQDLAVYHRAIEPLELQLLTRARDGAPFGVLCDLVAETLPIDEAAPAAFKHLATWLTDGLIARS
jgi:hypothetical protein